MLIRLLIRPVGAIVFLQGLVTLGALDISGDQDHVRGRLRVCDGLDKLDLLPAYHLGMVPIPLGLITIRSSNKKSVVNGGRRAGINNTCRNL